MSDCCSYDPPAYRSCDYGKPTKRAFQDIETICRNIEKAFQERDINSLEELSQCALENKHSYPLYQIQFIREFFLEKIEALKHGEAKQKAMQNLCSD